jgi:hypothetical protein
MAGSLIQNRRRLIAGAAGVALARPLAALAAPRRQMRVYGKTSWSESIMTVYLSHDLRTGLSYRICRFPELDDTWVWLQVIVEGRMYAYTDNDLPCATARNAPDSAMATYDAPGIRARMIRTGTSADLKAMSFAFDGRCHAGTQAQEGGGPVPVSVEGVFHPGQTHPHDQTGRFERTGHIEATLKVDGKSYTISDIGKQHEQTQTGPRFLKSFTYCNLWDADASFLGLMANDRMYGDYEIGADGRSVTRFAISRPAPDRRFAAVLADHARVTGEAHAAVTYEIPIYGQAWRGTMVSGVVEGRRLIGTINDWRPQNQHYPTDPDAI